MSSTLLVALGALVVGALIYFAGVQRGKSYRQEDRKARDAVRIEAEEERERQDRAQRVRRVVDAYLELVRTAVDTGLNALLRADVRSLRDGGEVREAVESIARRAVKNPLGKLAPRLEKVDLREFFGLLESNGLQVTNLEDVLRKLSV